MRDTLMEQSELVLAHCIGCGCDDHHSCDTDAGKCTWIVVDWELNVGVCSACKAALVAWKQGARSAAAVQASRQQEQPPLG
ncbi:hypothetical protein Q4488_14315 [Amphritea sp. 1_MG-2023]|uniref:hypothetical protein n=1 Tax=Amphritea sp. 1_MG-2023 TaxID=3062670 RepID=UPI0026E2FC65|nr:hypothetical protein [Amphritea sp. 1_MG-2023]MDO6564557.1 hypothetical protein [Amphritea sp. 1_MG-2023]